MEEKKYIFVLYDQDNSIIATSGYFDKYRQLPHLFSLKESKNVIEEKIYKKIEKMRKTTLINVCKLGNGGYPRYLGILIAPEEYINLLNLEEELKSELYQVKKDIIDQIPKLWEEKTGLEKDLLKVKKDIKNYKLETGK